MLAGEAVDELELRAFPDEVVAPGVPDEAARSIAAELDRELERPYEALAVRRGATAWMAGAKRVNAELAHLAGVPATSVEVAVSPDGERSAAVDGEPLDVLVDPALDAALRGLERRGAARFQAFVVRADKLDGERWQLTIDPL